VNRVLIPCHRVENPRRSRAGSRQRGYGRATRPTRRFQRALPAASSARQRAGARFPVPDKTPQFRRLKTAPTTAPGTKTASTYPCPAPPPADFRRRLLIIAPDHQGDQQCDTPQTNGKALTATRAASRPTGRRSLSALPTGPHSDAGRQRAVLRPAAYEPGRCRTDRFGESGHHQASLFFGPFSPFFDFDEITCQITCRD